MTRRCRAGSLFNRQKAALTYYRVSAGGESSGYVYSFGLRELCLRVARVAPAHGGFLNNHGYDHGLAIDRLLVDVVD